MSFLREQLGEDELRMLLDKVGLYAFSAAVKVSQSNASGPFVYDILVCAKLRHV